MNGNDYIDFIEFYESMLTLFSGDYSDLTKFIFKVYDFNRDNYITPEDIRLVLSYVPVNSGLPKEARLKFEK
jgi:Ca2+-binding EF-hand superfamily protein